MKKNFDCFEIEELDGLPADPDVPPGGGKK